jgi:hypothetical protein
MNITTDNSAVIAGLNKRIENLERYNLGLANESCSQQALIAELDANNKNLVEKNSFLRQRPDLSADRLPAYTLMKAKISELEEELTYAIEILEVRGVDYDEVRTAYLLEGVIK